MGCLNTLAGQFIVLPLVRSEIPDIFMLGGRQIVEPAYSSLALIAQASNVTD